MKRVVLTAAATVIALVLAGVAVAYFTLQGLASPANLARELESIYNLRAEVTESKLTLGFPTRLEIHGLTLAPRDASVEQGVPVADRPPLQSVAAIDFIELELRTVPLLTRQFVIENLLVERPTIEMEIYEDGTTSFDRLLKPPAPVAAAEAEAKPPGPRADPSAPLGVAKADQLPLASFLGGVSVEDATVLATVAKSKTTVQIHRGVIHLTDVDVDPNALADHNSANIEVAAWIGVDSFEKNTRYLDLAFDGTGAIQPFNSKTGELDPSLSAQVTVRKDSWIDTLPLLDDMEELIRQLEDFGVSLDGVRLRGDFSEDTTASFSASRRELRMTSDFMVPVDENFLVLEEGSWVNAGENDHDFFVTFIASERLTRKAEDEVDKFLRQKLGDGPAVPVKNALLRSVKQGDFLVLRFNSKGDMGNPEVAALTPFGDVGGLLNLPDATVDEVARQADRLLESLFGK
jgi:hypothetical protein